MDKGTRPAETYGLMIFAMLMIAVCLWAGVSIAWAFAASLGAAAALLRTKGMPFSAMGAIVGKALAGCRRLFGLILTVGAVVAVWLASGVVPAMIYYGAGMIRGPAGLAAVFCLSGLVGYFTGTALGTVSILGLAFLGAGAASGIPPFLTVGAVVSGAFVAEKASPLSGLLNMSMTLNATDYRRTFPVMLQTFWIAWALSLAGYAAVGILMGPSAPAGADAVRAGLSESFVLHPLLFALPLFLLLLVARGMDILKASAGVSAAGLAVAVFVQGLPAGRIPAILWKGYEAETSSDFLNGLLRGGGMGNMLEVVLIIAGAVSLGMLMEASGLLDAVIVGIRKNIDSPQRLILRTGLAAVFLTLVSDQAVSVVLSNRFFEETYDAFGIRREILVRTLADTGIAVAPLIPWNVNTLVISALTGIPLYRYGPFAFLCIASPLAVWIHTGFNRNGLTDSNNDGEV